MNKLVIAVFAAFAVLFANAIPVALHAAAEEKTPKASASEKQEQLKFLPVSASNEENATNTATDPFQMFLQRSARPPTCDGVARCCPRGYRCGVPRGGGSKECVGPADGVVSSVDCAVIEACPGPEVDYHSLSGKACDFEGRCDFGEETCCGVTHAAISCSCSGGSFSCSHTDACMGQSGCATCPTDMPISSSGQGSWCSGQGQDYLECKYHPSECCGETRYFSTATCTGMGDCTKRYADCKWQFESTYVECPNPCPNDLCAGKKCGDVCANSQGMLMVMRFCQADGTCASDAKPNCGHTHPCDTPTQGGCGHFCFKKGEKFECGCKGGYRLKADNKSCDVIHPCEFPDKGGCDQICLKDGEDAKCACYKGEQLKADGTSCEPE